MTWLSKLKRYDGSETVLGYHDSRLAAAEQVAGYNSRYQTNTAYIEEYDAAKSEWPTLARRAFENEVRRRRNGAHDTP